MSELADRTIAALRAEHDSLTTLLPNLTDEQLAGPSGASEWTIAQVLSHLGSGAEIGRLPIARALGESVPDEDNESIWARWDAAGPVDQAAGFVRHGQAYLDTIESLTPEQRESLIVDLGFLPEPVPLVVALGMRLNEVSAHAWDVRVGLDPAAGVNPDSATLVLELLAGPVSFLLGFAARADELAEPARVSIPGGGAIEIADEVALRTGLADPTATFDGPQEAVVRLLSGRLKPEHTPEEVQVTGNVTLDDLRKVFPGY